MADSIRDSIRTQKNDSQLPSAKYYNLHIIETIALIPTKFGKFHVTETTKYSLWVVQTGI